MIVNGVMQALGSNRSDIEEAVTQSHQKAQALSVPVQLAFGDDRLTVTVPKANGEPSAGEVWLCPVSRAVADLPYAVVRRHAYDDPLPDWLEDDVAAAARALLRGFGERA